MNKIDETNGVGSKSQGTLIYLDGIGGVGKSTLAKAFSEKYSYKMYELPGKLFPEIEKYANSLEIDKKAKFLANSLSRALTYPLIMKDILEGINVIVDGSFLSPLVYQSIIDDIDIKILFNIELDLLQPPLPTLFVLVKSKKITDGGENILNKEAQEFQRVFNSAYDDLFSLLRSNKVIFYNNMISVDYDVNELYKVVVERSSNQVKGTSNIIQVVRD